MSNPWPALPYAELRPTLQTLQLFAQIAGKVRLVGTPWLNHSWHVTFTVSARGLITALIPHKDFSFDIEFDFVSDIVAIRTTNGTSAQVALAPKSVATFYAEFLNALSSLGIVISIDRMPNELPDPKPFHLAPRRAPTIQTPRGFSGARWCRPSAFCSVSARASSARAVPCISSGAVSIWR
jgi:hypothetical protein